MHDTILNSGWDTFLVAVPFLGLLFIGLFRLDELFASKRKTVKRRAMTCGLDESGSPIFCEPDGRPLAVAPTRK